MKILIAGDSFATVWPDSQLGWPTLLAKKYNVVNLAQAGIGEYKILKQIESQEIKDFDLVIVSHTSPSRLHTNNHPVHKEGFHKNCDLILNDLINRSTFRNPSLKAAQEYFKYHYDDEYQIDIYRLIRKQINELITIPYISMSHVDIVNTLAIETNHLDFSNLWSKERGSMNHYTVEGNFKIFETLEDIISA
jgi:hypothetical protein